MLLSIGRRTPAEDLVGMLLECHDRIRRFTALAVALGGEMPAGEVAEAVDACTRYFTQALPLHVADEEQSVLPRLGARPALASMRAQHAEHDALLTDLLGRLAALRDRPGDVAARTAVRTAAEPLARAFDEHLRFEESVIFPAIRATIPPDEQRRAVEEIRARRR